MRGQPHLVVASEPLKQGENYQALCGKELTDAVWVWQVVERGEVIDRLRTCSKCWRALTVEQVTQYVYGAIPGAEANLAETA